MLDMFVSGTAPIPSHVKALNLPQIIGWEKGKVWTEIEIDPGLLNPQGALFDGYITAVADELLGLAVLSTLAEGESVVTSSRVLCIFSGQLELEEFRLKRRSFTVEAGARFQKYSSIPRAGNSRLRVAQRKLLYPKNKLSRRRVTSGSVTGFNEPKTRTGKLWAR